VRRPAAVARRTDQAQGGAVLPGQEAHQSRRLLRHRQEGHARPRHLGPADLDPDRRPGPRTRPHRGRSRLGQARGTRPDEGRRRLMAGPLVTITGASSGIGLALAHAFAKEGNALLLIARHMTLPAGLPSDRTVCAEVDVADYAALEKAIRDAEAK